MANKDFTLTSELLRELLDYDPETGVFVWKPRPVKYFSSKQSFSCWNNKYSGQVAGRAHSCGYWELIVLYKRIYAHRAAWLYVYGEPPKGVMDHINGNRRDNRICNLRIATHSQNCWNMRTGGRGTSRFKGVSFHKKGQCWRAQIGFNGENIHLGSYSSEKDAANAVQSAREGLHKEYACHD